ncbi:MAG: lamin tail domain-containing protein, partial [Verrucomicrobiota bacterium]
MNSQAPKSFFTVVLLLFALQTHGEVVISEFMAINNGVLLDEFGDDPDWIELHNPAATNINLAGWFLTDDAANLMKWIFPPTNIPPNGFIIVFASNKTNAMTDLHANFKLSGGGEYLALVEPNGTSIAHHFSPAFPPQFTDISYGLSMSTPINLRAHWTFDDPSSTANLLSDSSTVGADNSGALLAGTPPIGRVGVVGGSIELLGNQNIDFGNSSDFTRTTWTVSVWLYNDLGVTGWRTAFGSWGNSTPFHAFHIGRDSAGTWGDHGGGQTSGGSVQDRRWTHIVSTRTPNGQENALWIDGVKQAQTSFGAPAIPGAVNAYLGTKNGSQNDWDGRIDDLGYFDDVLTS